MKIELPRPHLTVAAIVEQDDRLLMVREMCAGTLKLNQPAGHVENAESLAQAVQRECLEETRWLVEPAYLLGMSQFNAPNGITYMRVSIICKPIKELQERELDSDISEACWLSREQIHAEKHSHRSCMVANDIQRYDAGFRFSLTDIYSLLPSLTGK